jgi:hypothetical protein
MDIDRKLLSRAAALLSEARDVVERVRAKASADFEEQGTDGDKLEDLNALTESVQAVIRTADKLAKED